MESTVQQASEGMAVVRVLAAVLERLVNSNAHVAKAHPGQITKFHALKAPGICILQYLERIHKYASCSTECFILALIYIDRLIQRNNFLLTELNVHRVVITAVLLAAKFFDDAYYNNAYYAKVGGVLVSEMNGLEVEFLFRINFSLHVTPEVFMKYQAELVSHAIGAGLEEPKTNLSLPPSPQTISSHSTTTGGSISCSSVNEYKSIQEQIKNHVEAPTSFDESLHDHSHVVSTNTYQEERHAQQITPSPPPSTANPESVPGSGDDLNCNFPSEDMMHNPVPGNLSSPANSAPGGTVNEQNCNFPALQRNHSFPAVNPQIPYPTTATHMKLAGSLKLVTPRNIDLKYVHPTIQNNMVHPDQYNHLIHPASYQVNPHLSRHTHASDTMLLGCSPYGRRHSEHGYVHESISPGAPSSPHFVDVTSSGYR